MLEKYGLVKKLVYQSIYGEFQSLNQQLVVSSSLEFSLPLEAFPSFELIFSKFENYLEQRRDLNFFQCCHHENDLNLYLNELIEVLLSFHWL